MVNTGTRYPLTDGPTYGKTPQVDYGKAAYTAIQEVVQPLRLEDPVTRFEGATDILLALNDAIGLAASQRRAQAVATEKVMAIGTPKARE